MSSTSFPVGATIPICMISACVTVLTVPQVKKIGEKLGFTDQPDDRKQHKAPLVRLGGIAIVFGFVLAISFWLLRNSLIGIDSNQVIILTIFASSLSCFLIGLADDLFTMSPWPRLALQISVATYAWSQGISIRAFEFLPGLTIEKIILNDFLSLLLTVIWLVGVTNAINWIDGLDGLAAGISIIAASFIALISYSNGQVELTIIATAFIGSCIGFLIFNFYPAKIVMGDGGSYFLGFTLATLSLICFTDKGFIDHSTSFNIFLSFLILAIPIMDLCIVIFTRIYKGYSPFYPDRRHIHHRLLSMGISHRQTVFLIYAAAQWLGTLAYFIFVGRVYSLPAVLSSFILGFTLLKSISFLKEKKS